MPIINIDISFLNINKSFISIKKSFININKCSFCPHLPFHIIPSIAVFERIYILHLIIIIYTCSGHILW